jgi:hypothetical protein
MRLQTVEQGNVPMHPTNAQPFQSPKSEEKVCLKLLQRAEDRKPLI